jgi:hypothetical protein
MYLRIYVDRMVLRRVDTGQECDRSSTAPFTSKRLLIGHFPEASDLLNGMMRDVNDRVGPLSRNSQLVVHPMEMTEEGLSAVEQRAFQDLGEFSGSKPVMVVTGTEVLNDAQVLRILEGSRR